MRPQLPQRRIADSVAVVRRQFCTKTVGSAAGVNAVCHRLARLRHDLGVDFCIANSENAHEGHGITACIAERLFRAEVDVITLGDHLWSDPEIGEYVSNRPRSFDQ